MILTKKLLINCDPLFKNITDDTFIRTCNKTGIEVEKISRFNIIENLQIVKILEINKHPNADRLNIVKIDLGNNNYQEIVCGANNLIVNKYAIYAPIGTKFKHFIIQPKEIRGVRSEGMLCGYEEILDINSDLINNDDKQGIVLFDEATVGDFNISKYLNLDDTIYELSFASNRNDLNSVISFVNEFKYAYNQTNFLHKDIKFNNNIGWTSIKQVDDNFINDCSFILIKNIKPFKPNWKQKEILIACDYHIYNDWRDLINLFTIYYGNSINIYDASNIELKNISIKQVINETEILNNEKKYKIPVSSFAIYNNDEIINALGILINDKYKYNTNSSSILIEISNYNYKIINQYNKQLNVNNKIQQLVSKPLASWITQNTYNELINYLFVQYKDLETIRNFEKIICEIIGYDVYELYKFIGYNGILEFNQTLEWGKYNLHPSRLDVQNQYDVFEEALKIINMDLLQPQDFEFNYQKTNYEKYNNIQKIKSYFIDWNFYETKTYNLSNEQEYHKFNLFKFNETLKIINPISLNRQFLRCNPINEQLKVLKYNLSRKRELKNIFEIQNINSSFNKFHQILSLVISTDLINNKVANNLVNNSFINIKSLIFNAFKKININLEFLNCLESYNEFSEIKLINKGIKNIGYIAKLSNEIKKEYDLDEIKDLYIILIDLDHLLANNKNQQIKSISNFPLIYRDINIEINDENKLNNIVDNIKNITNINDCIIKDFFIKDNQRIYTLNITISDNNKTLNSQEIEDIINQINQLICTLNN